MNQLKLAIGASFTADALDQFAPFWSRPLGLGVQFSLTPAANLYQALLTPDSALNDRDAAARILLVRLSDLGVDATGAARELATAINATGLSFTIILCPDRRDCESAILETVFLSAVDERCEILAGADIFARYRVTEPFDARADKAALVPYAPEAFAALSAELVRRAYAAQRAPLKMAAVDCDNTLWRGVVGEEGVAGVRVDAAAIALQRRLKTLSDAGVAIALLSKNNDDDVLSVFEQRTDMALKLDHVLARSVNWRDKSENLAAIARQIGFAEESIVFLDDNPIEIAAVEARLPGVMTATVSPTIDFAEHLWVLDTVSTTDEDRRRRQMYRDDAARTNEAKTAPTLKAFIDGLDLNVDIVSADKSNIARLAQLTQRTNQFNTSLQRFTEPELAAWVTERERCLFAVSAKDRFGDYGVVGVIGLEQRADQISVELFSLSCRALGRGVEHQMAAHIGDTARRAAAGDVSFVFTRGPRNEPAQQFLASAMGREPEEGGNRMDATVLASIKFDPSGTATLSDQSKPARRSLSNTPVVDWSYIANELTTGRAILRAANEERRRARNLETTFVAPAHGLEKDIARIWEDVLAVSPVGAEDSFGALGGQSIDLVQVHSRLVGVLQRPLDLTLLFECSTPAQLARRLGNQNACAELSVSARATAMIRARGYRAARLKEARETLQ